MTMLNEVEEAELGQLNLFLWSWKNFKIIKKGPVALTQLALPQDGLDE